MTALRLVASTTEAERWWERVRETLSDLPYTGDSEDILTTVLREVGYYDVEASEYEGLLDCDPQAMARLWWSDRAKFTGDMQDLAELRALTRAIFADDEEGENVE